MSDVVIRIRSENMTEKDFRQVREDLSKLTTLSQSQTAALKQTASAEAAVARASKAKIAVQREEEKLAQDRLRTERLREQATGRTVAAEKRATAERERLINKEIADVHRKLKAERQVLKDAITYRKTLIREEEKARRATERSTRASRHFGGVLDFVKGSLASLSAEMTIFAGIDLGRNFIDASRQMEGYRETLKALVGDSDEAERQLSEVLALSRQPGLTAQSAVKEFVQLTAIDIDLPRTIDLIREMGNALALAGQQDLSPALLGLRQIYQRSKLSQEEINQITERLGLASKVLKVEFGSAIGEDIQAALDAAGEDIDDFTDRFIAGLKKLPRAPLDTLIAVQNRLRGATFELSAAIGDALTPTFAKAVITLEVYADTLRKVIQGETELETITRKVTEQSEGVGNFVEGLIELGKGLETAFEGVPEDLLSISESLISITGNIATLTGALLQLEGAGAVFRKVFGLDALAALDNLLKLASAGTDELTGLLTGRGSDAFEKFRAETLDSPPASERASVESLVKAAVQEAIIAPLSGQGISANAGAGADSGRLYQRESTFVGAFEKSVREANTAARQLTATVSDFPAVTRAIEPLGKGFASSANTVSDLNNRLAKSQGLLHENAEELGMYAEAASQVVPSVINLTQAEKDYGDAVAANLEILRLATSGELKQLTQKERAVQVYKDSEKVMRDYEKANLNASRAVAESNKRIEAAPIRTHGGDIDKATANLRAYQKVRERNLELEKEEAQAESIRIRRLQREQAAFEGLVDRINAFDAQRASRTIATFGDYVNRRESAAQRRGFGDIVDDTVQGLGYRNKTEAGIDLGAEAASIAISYLGDLRKAEQERAASLIELEQQTSAKIVEINQRKARQLWEISQRIEAEDKRRFEEIKGVFRDAKDAEIAARQTAATAIVDIETAADARRAEVKKAYFAEIEGIETEYTRDVDALREGLADREKQRTERLTEIATQAAADRTAAQTEYNATLQRIQNDLVDGILAVREQLTEDLKALDDGLAAREKQRATEKVALDRKVAADRIAIEDRYAERSEQIQTELSETLTGIKANLIEQLDRIDEGYAEREKQRTERRKALESQATADRLAAQERLNAENETIARNLVDAYLAIETKLQDDLKALRATAATDRQTAEDTYAATEITAAENLTETLINIETARLDRTKAIRTKYAADLDALEAGFTARDIAREEQRIALREQFTEREAAIEKTATDARLRATETYIDDIQNINQRLVFAVQAQQDEITRITDTAARERERITENAADARLAAEDRYQAGVLRLQTDLGRELERLEDRRAANTLRTAESLSDLELQASRRREDLELRLARDLTDSPDREAQLQLRFDRAVEDLGIQTARREADIQTRAERDAQALSDAEAEAREAAGVEPVFEKAISAFERLEATLKATLGTIDKDETDSLAEVEKTRAEGIAEAHARILKLETEAGVTYEQALKFLPETVDATTAAFDRLIATLDSITATRSEGLAAAESTRDTGIGEIDAAAGLDVTQTEAERTGLRKTAGESEAKALQDASIANAAAITENQTTLKTAFDVLQTTLASIDAKLDADETALTGTASAAQAQLEREAGLTFEQALENYVPAVDAATAALNTFNESITKINTQLGVDLANINAAGTADAAATQTQRESAIGDTITAAILAGGRATADETAAATERDEALAAIGARYVEDFFKIVNAGIADRAATGTARQGLIDTATATEGRLESEAGITFETALENYVPAVDAATAALNTFNESLAKINAQFTADTDAVLAEGSADRGETAVAILARGEERDAAVDVATARYRATRLAITEQEAADIAEIKTTLTDRLTSIDSGIEQSLAAIRANKLDFDTAIFNEIHNVNAAALEDLGAVRQDAQAQRNAIEAIAQEAKDNAWKKAMLKVANVGVTVIGAGVGAAVGGTAGAAVGAQIGGALGGLIEQVGAQQINQVEVQVIEHNAFVRQNPLGKAWKKLRHIVANDSKSVLLGDVGQLFDWEQTDRMAFEAAKAAGRRQAQQQQNFFPTPAQLQNARDVAPYLVKGMQAGQQEGGGSQQPIVIENRVTLEVDASVLAEVLDQALVERAKDGQTYGSYLRG